MLEFLKVLVQPVLIERDEDGRIVGEKLGEARPCYSLDEVVQFTEELQKAVERENAPAPSSIVIPQAVPVNHG